MSSQSRARRLPKPRQTVALLIASPGRPAIVVGWPTKAAEEGSGTLTVPTGGIEDGESPTLAAVRESPQELCLVIAPEMVTELQHPSFVFKTRSGLKEYRWVLVLVPPGPDFPQTEEMVGSWWYCFERMAASKNQLSANKRHMMAAILQIVIDLENNPFQNGLKRKAEVLIRRLREK